MLLFWFIVIVQKLNVLHSFLTDIDNAQAIYRHLYVVFCLYLKTVGLTMMAIHIQTMHTKKRQRDKNFDRVLNSGDMIEMWVI